MWPRRQDLDYSVIGAPVSDRELEDLQNLIKHPGWLRFIGQVKREIASMLNSQIEAVSNDPNDAIAANKVRQIIASKKSIERLIAWPYERVGKMEKKLLADAQPQIMSRGGV